MRGYYVIGYDEPIEFVGRGAKRKAINKALELYASGECLHPIVQRFNDDNCKGYFAEEETLYISDILKG